MLPILKKETVLPNRLLADGWKIYNKHDALDRDTFDLICGLSLSKTVGGHESHDISAFKIQKMDTQNDPYVRSVCCGHGHKRKA